MSGHPPILAPDFAGLVSSAGLDGLDDTIAYGLWPDFTLAWCNAAYVRFAKENGGDVARVCALGSDVTRAFGVLWRFYVRHLSRVLLTGEPWEHTYECSSPDGFRKFRMVATRLDNQGLALVHALQCCTPHGDPRSGEGWVHDDGLLHACAHCRRFRDPQDPVHWEMVPSLMLQAPRPVSHGLCPPCYALYSVP